jgi:hypothetical protein
LIRIDEGDAIAAISRIEEADELIENDESAPEGSVPEEPNSSTETNETIE